MMIWCWRSGNCHHGQGDGTKIASAPSSSSWEVYNGPDSSKLEAAYIAFHDQIQTSSTNHVSTSDENGRTVILQRGSNVYICDIVKMEQRNLDTGFIRSIHRGWPTRKEFISSDSIKTKSKKSSSITNTMSSVTANAAPSSAVGRVPCPATASTTLPVPNNHHHNNNNQNDINYHHRVTGLVKKLNRDEIFVFGSNEAGRHGLGAAKIARQKWGAIYGQAEGLQGRTYGIPTKDKYVRDPLPVKRIEYYVQRFVKFATDHRHFKFCVTEIGCGLSGYTPNDIAPLFQSAIHIENICLPESFWKHLLSPGVGSSIVSQVATTTTTTTTKNAGAGTSNNRRENKFTWNNH